MELELITLTCLWPRRTVQFSSTNTRYPVWSMDFALLEIPWTLNLRPYDCRKSDGESCKELTDANMSVTETANLDAAEEKAARKEVGGGWDPTYTREVFSHIGDQCYKLGFL